MPNPKRQHSKARSRKRRGGHVKIRIASLATCSHCHKPIVPHRVCPFCGYYKGKMVIDLTPEPVQDSTK